MITIRPFRALLPPTAKADQIAAVPYDVVNTEEASALAEGNPLSFLRVSRPEIELPPGTDLYSDPVYETAAANFQRLRDTAPLTIDSEPALYVYSLVMDGRRQTGLVVAASVDDYDADRIKKHEKTRRDKEDDRTRHTVTLRAHTGPVFLTCRDSGTLADMFTAVMSGDALYDVTAEDGVQHQIWRVSEADSAPFVEHFTQVSALYVADGHHRAKSASRAREACQADNPNHTGDEDYNRFLAVVFPAPQLAILAYNRAVHDLNGQDQDSYLERVKAEFPLTPCEDGTTTGLGDIRMYLGGQWYRLTAAAADNASVVDQLDVSILQERLLAPILGIDDPRTSKRIDFVGGIHGSERLVQMVDSGRAAVAFSMYPVTVDQLMAISDADMIMPPKSTWFEPKLRDGFVGHCF